MRTFFGSGFFPRSTPPPEAYAALVAFFGDDAAAANAWVAAWIAYAATGADAAELLAALEALGPPDVALIAVNTSSIQVEALTPYADLDSPIYDGIAYEAPAGPIPTPVELGVF